MARKAGTVSFTKIVISDWSAIDKATSNYNIRSNSGKQSSGSRRTTRRSATVSLALPANVAMTSHGGMLRAEIGILGERGTEDGIRTTGGRGRLYDNVLDTIGDTPCIRINRLAPSHVRLYVKAEAFNPGGSVKDRLAVNIIEAAERAGTLKPGQTVVEATSGNTGIGLAMVCAQKGYPLVVTMADSFSIERRRLMRMLGAKVVLTPRAEKGLGMYRKAVELAEAHGWFLARQFETDANADIHEATTAREILADFNGDRLDYFVTGSGTGGTLSGVARVLRRDRPDTKIVLTEPANAALVDSGTPTQRADDGSPLGSHPSWQPHPIQGWTPDFIPLVLQESIDRVFYDDLIPIPGPEGIRGAMDLARMEGIFTGISGGSTFAVAVKVAETAPEGSVNPAGARLPVRAGDRRGRCPAFEQRISIAFRQLAPRLQARRLQAGPRLSIRGNQSPPP